MIKQFIDRIGVNSYIRKLNNKQLKDVFLKLSKKMPKTYGENLIIDCCIKEMNKRGLL